MEALLNTSDLLYNKTTAMSNSSLKHVCWIFIKSLLDKVLIPLKYSIWLGTVLFLSNMYKS